MKAATVRTASFGPYALDLHSGELRKYGMKVKMGGQPFWILCTLLENPGKMVGREELRAKLWADDTFVDFDNGLNSAVQRLRDCLSDSAAKPRWVETVPRRGYRFIGQVEWSEGANSDSPRELNGGMQSPVLQTEVHTTSVADSSTAESSNPPRQETSWAKHRRGFVFLAAALLSVTPWIVKWIHDWQSQQQPRLIRSIAVIPLMNYSGDSNEEFFADGVTDELITEVAKNNSLNVTSRTSVVQYKNAHRPVREIAKALGVEGILEGSISRAGNRVHMTVQLIDGADDRHVWAESYDRDLNDLSSVLQEIAGGVANKVGVRLVNPVPPAKSINPEAHDAYLRGRDHWFAFDVDQAEQQFRKATDLQRDYAAAWSGLSNTLVVQALIGEKQSAAVMPDAEKCAKRALELDDSLADAHNSMAAAAFQSHL